MLTVRSFGRLFPESMIKLDLSHTELRPDGLRFDPLSGVLFAQRPRVKRDANQPRKTFDPEKLASLRADIDEWRKAKRGPCGSGFLEPLKGRWEPGTLGSDGNPTPKSKIILWDGERRWRVTEDYEWLPLILDDISAIEARSAALRTSIHKELLSPVELAYALAEEKTAKKWSNEKLGKSYGFGESWARNRVKIPGIDKSLQKMVDTDDKTMSHALELHDSGIPVAEYKGFIEEILDPKILLSVPDLKSSIQYFKEHGKRLSQSTQPPDTETKQRAAENERSGGGNVSRGKQVTGWTQKDYRNAATFKIQMLDKYMEELQELQEHVTASYWEKTVAPEIKRIARKLSAVGK